MTPSRTKSRYSGRRRRCRRGCDPIEMTHSVIVIVPSRVAQVAATIALVLPLLAQAADAQQARSSRRDARDRVDTTFAFDKRGTVTLRAGSGDIIVHGWTRDEIQIHASSENDNIRLDASPGRVSLELTSSRHDDSRFDVTVPVGARVIAHAQSGDISIRGTKGEVEVTSQSGAIELEDVTGRLDVNTTSGDLKGRGIAADVDITSISGDIGLTDVRGNIGIQSTSGEITLRSAVSRLARSIPLDATISPRIRVTCAWRFRRMRARSSPSRPGAARSSAISRSPFSRANNASARPTPSGSRSTSAAAPRASR